MLRSGETTVEEKFDAAGQGIFDILLSRVLEMKKSDVTKLAREARMFQQARLLQRKAEMAEKRLELDSEKLELDRREMEQKLADFEARQAKAREAAGELLRTREFTAETMAKFREALGLND
jgi:hypothetical protein